MKLVFKICSGLSNVWFIVHYILIKVHCCNSPVFFENTIGDKYSVLRSVWYTKIMRRAISFLIRTPLKQSILKLIIVNILAPGNSGCVITMCRTPWKRLMAQWCLKEKYGLLITAFQYKDDRRHIHRRGRDVRELLTLVKHLKAGGKVIALIDIFNDLHDCPVYFMGHHQNVSLFVERLAALANVPIMINIPRLSGKSFDFISGPTFSTIGINAKKGVLTREILSFVETEIKTNPAIWSNYIYYFFFPASCLQCF